MLRQGETLISHNPGCKVLTQASDKLSHANHVIRAVWWESCSFFLHYTDNIISCFSKLLRTERQSNESTKDLKAAVLFAHPFIWEAFNIFSSLCFRVNVLMWSLSKTGTDVHWECAGSDAVYLINSCNAEITVSLPKQLSVYANTTIKLLYLKSQSASWGYLHRGWL